MNDIKQLQQITVEKIFVNYVYFSFLDSNRTEDWFRARIKLESWENHDELVDAVSKIATAGDSHELVARKFREFVQNNELDFYKKQRFEEFANQLEAGSGSMTRRGEQLFEDCPTIFTASK